MRAYAFVTNARELTQLKNRRFLSFLDIKCKQKATLVQGTTSVIDLNLTKHANKIVLRGPRGPRGSRDPKVPKVPKIPKVLKVPKGPNGSRGPQDPSCERYQILKALPAQRGQQV